MGPTSRRPPSHRRVGSPWAGGQPCLHCLVRCSQLLRHCISRWRCSGFCASFGSPVHALMQSEACWWHFASQADCARAMVAARTPARTKKRTGGTLPQGRPPSVPFDPSHWAMQASSWGPRASLGWPAHCLRHVARSFAASRAGGASATAAAATASQTMTSERVTGGFDAGTCGVFELALRSLLVATSSGGRRPGRPAGPRGRLRR